MNRIAEVEQQILESAAHSPQLALMMLSLEIDREIRKLLASTGVLRSYTSQSLPEAIALLEQRVRVPADIRLTVSEFWSIRNAVVHAHVEDTSVPLRALDYGLRILRMLRSIPRPSYIVVHANVPLYSDQGCQNPRSDVRGVILEARSPEGTITDAHIHPSTRQYRVGESLSWEWNYENTRNWGDTWYRDPETQEIKHAWSEAMEFIGRPIDQV